MFDRAIQILNTILTINVFFVLLAFGWFILAIVGKYTDTPLGMDLWQSLWVPVFQPAIGALMGGAILSGVIGYIKGKLPTKK
jgi:TRAP-type C4-dicarboxylate transport system permease small subunit